MRSNIGIIIKMSCNKDIIKKFYYIHKRFKVSKSYKITNMMKCGLNIIKNDRIVQHNGDYVINSFLPPLNGVGISIDSINPEVHDKKRGYKGAYNNSIEAIKNCKKAGIYTMAQTVCTKEMMKSGEIEELAKELKKIGIDELRILEPIPCGSLLNESSEILSSDEKKEIINLHIKFNRDKIYPKTSVFPYIESKEQFGCGAGIQHSYIDDKGNFLPCDFVPEAFGNVFDNDVKDIWNKMHGKFERARSYCYAKGCSKCNDTELPKYYKLLDGSYKRI